MKKLKIEHALFFMAFNIDVDYQPLSMWKSVMQRQAKQLIRIRLICTTG